MVAFGGVARQAAQRGDRFVVFEAVERAFGRLGVLHGARPAVVEAALRSEEHTSELQSLMRTSYAVFCLKKKKPIKINNLYLILSLSHLQLRFHRDLFLNIFATHNKLHPIT